ncbi:excalibur calcium-binding domain-containing protein [Actinoplanes sp. NPDC023714]|uniref:excalibur calcium-binding domain-containing protein n=1 Tax=Actinoplanes sp. NPDC023714 TaxID=3154322 RepID=UPI00340502CC
MSPRPAASKSPKPISYANCAAVEAAGKAPILEGEPGFRPAFDRDGDGVGCEQGGDDEPAPPQDEESGGGTDPRFATCAKAIAAGFGPYYEGTDPEYDWYIDRDGDGAVCE